MGVLFLFMEILIIVILTSLLLIREYATYKERQKLLDRIMSQNYSEFKDMETPEENEYGPKENEDEIDIDDSKEEILKEEEEDG